MNAVKTHGEATAALVDQIRNAGGDPRCIATATTQLQTGHMRLTRAVAKPEGF